MRIIAVDDEKLALLSLERAIEEAIPEAIIETFRSPLAAFEYAKDNKIDVAFLDVEMRGMTGLDLASQLKELYPKINIIFVTGFSEYALDAVKMHASGYLEKPVLREDILSELNNLRNPLDREVEPDSRIRVQTFGNFDIFVDNKPVSFGRSKAKEILAYLIDKRGSNVSRPELASILWEEQEYDRSLQKQLQIYISDLVKSLKNVNAEDVIIRSSGLMCVDPSKFKCDYYAFIKGEQWAITNYQGEYMSNYSWAEFTTGYLEQLMWRK